LAKHLRRDEYVFIVCFWEEKKWRYYRATRELEAYLFIFFASKNLIYWFLLNYDTMNLYSYRWHMLLSHHATTGFFIGYNLQTYGHLWNLIVSVSLMNRPNQRRYLLLAGNPLKRREKYNRIFVNATASNKKKINLKGFLKWFFDKKKLETCTTSMTPMWPCRTSERGPIHD